MEQVLYSLPDGWKWHKLKDLTTKIGSGATPKGGEKAYKSSGISLIRSLNVHDCFFKEEKLAFIDDEQANGLKNVVVESGDVLLNITGASIARCCIVPNEFLPARVNQHVAIIRPTEYVDSKFLNYLIINPKFKAQLLWLGAGGATRQALTKAMVEELNIPLPSLPEQKRIVEKLDALLTRIDTAIEHLQQSVTLADALYASELNEVFPSDADIESLSDKAGWVSLSDICTFENGDRGKNYPSKSAFVAEGIPVVSAGNLGERYIDHKGLNYITPERYDLLRSGRIKIGDILFCLRGSLGKVAISKDLDEGVIASSLVIIRPKACVSAEYIYKYLKSSLCQQFISFYNNGAAQPNLSAKSLGKFMLPLPNADEQKIIIDGLDEKYQHNQKLLDALRGKIDSLKILKASILDSAFKGEL
ncbi:hypothetical protein J7X41_004257 [Vibrio parahaemolyticus]|nr:hypothetical protein [Vibrio parahaemolyticus]